jgi:hypothetical protein
MPTRAAKQPVTFEPTVVAWSGCRQRKSSAPGPSEEQRHWDLQMLRTQRVSKIVEFQPHAEGSHGMP